MVVTRSFIVGWLLVCSCHKDAANEAKGVGAQCDVAGSDHDMLFRRGADLIGPHMLLVDRKPIARNDEEVRVGIACLERALEIAPSNWSALWVRGKAFQSLGDHVRAVESFRAAYQLQSANPNIGRELVEGLLDTREFAEATKVAQKVVDLQPQDAALRANLAVALVLDGKLAPAQQAVEEALRLAPNDSISQALAKRISEIASGVRPQPKTIEELQR